MAVMPRDQMSHSSLYPPFRATAATSGAILWAETLREQEVTQGQERGRARGNAGTDRARGEDAKTKLQKELERESVDGGTRDPSMLEANARSQPGLRTEALTQKKGREEMRQTLGCGSVTQ